MSVLGGDQWNRSQVSWRKICLTHAYLLSHGFHSQFSVPPQKTHVIRHLAEHLMKEKRLARDDQKTPMQARDIPSGYHERVSAIFEY